MASKNRRRFSRRYRASLPVHDVPRRLPRPRVDIDRGLAVVCPVDGSEGRRRLQASLRDSGLATFAPLESVEVVRRGVPVEVERPAFSRYLFVGLNAACPEWSAVHAALEGHSWWLPGVPSLGRILLAGGEPLRVPVNCLCSLAERLSGVGAVPSHPYPLEPVYGLLMGFGLDLTGVVEKSGDERVHALLDLFGRKTLVEFAVEQLEAA